jgi:DNA repair protein RecN (Recombination protein N)
MDGSTWPPPWSPSRLKNKQNSNALKEGFGNTKSENGMLRSLRIKNLATIHEVELDLESGFSVLTGETGAGKSMVIEGIRLALGEKGTADVIRTGSQETLIEADFNRPEYGSVEDSPPVIYIQRRISPTGAGRAYLDGTPIPLKKLREYRDSLVDIYGQNDHVFLRELDNQLEYLDSYADALGLRRQVAQAAAECRRLHRRRQELLTSARERQRRQDFLQYQIQEIEKARLVPEEESELKQERAILKNTEKIGQWVEEALDLTHTRDSSLTSLLSRLQPLLDRLSEYDDECRSARESCEQFQITANELSDHLLQFRDTQDRSPARLEELESRLSQIEHLKRKYTGDVKEILEFLERSRMEFSELDQSEERLKEVEEELRQRSAEYGKLSAALRKKRVKSSGVLEKEIEREIALLGMKKARFAVQLTHLELDPERPDLWQDTGTENLEFLLSPNPGEDLKPLRKIASGGELSRFMLALKSVARVPSESKTLIFDEIDAGIGGKTAEFVARKLRDLALTNQVICITHLPQIASFATHHFRITKHVDKNRTFTGVQRLTPQERIDEITRLLAGSHITPTARRTAQEMLEKNLGSGREPS